MNVHLKRSSRFNRSSDEISKGEGSFVIAPGDVDGKLTAIVKREISKTYLERKILAHKTG